LPGEVWEARLEPEVISFNAGITACEKGEQWQQALSLIGVMQEAELEPDIMSYNAGVSVCHEIGYFKGLLWLFELRSECRLLN